MLTSVAHPQEPDPGYALKTKTLGNILSVKNIQAINR